METTYPHQEAMEDNNFQLKDLPEAIRKKVYSWNNKYKNFTENPTERAKDNLTKDSVAIADSIQDYAEQGLEEENPQPDMTPSEQNQPNVPQIAGIVNQQSNSDLQQAIQGYLSKEGRIYHIDLKKLMGQGSIPDRVEVGELVLQRNFAFYYPA